jgi:uncharacterized protein (DUF488 family)
MSTLYTIGYQGRPLAEFIGLLQAAGVDAVIDVRLRNTSHLAGFTKRDDLAFLLRQGFGIAYEHHLELAPTPELLDAYTADHDWQRYTQRFGLLLAERQSELVGRDVLGRFHAPCLLCSERLPEQCHRRLIAEWWVVHIPDCALVHLGTEYQKRLPRRRKGRQVSDS